MIQMFHVYKAYPGDPPVLSDINLHVEKGEFVFLTGPLGRGEDDAAQAHVLRGAGRPGGRSSWAGGTSRASASPAVPYLRRNIGVVFQDFKLLPHRTVADNVAFTLDVLGVPRDEAREQGAPRCSSWWGSSTRRARYPLRLSGGEQQRVVIARALVNDPTILLADEPTGNLDPALTVEIMDLLCDVNVRGTTVVVATHDTSLLARYQKRTVRLERGPSSRTRTASRRRGGWRRYERAWRRSPYFWRSAAGGLRHAPFVHFIAVTTIAIALFAAGLARAAAARWTGCSASLGGEVEVTVYLAPDARAAEQAEALRSQRWRRPAAERGARAAGRGAEAAGPRAGRPRAMRSRSCPENPLPPSLELTVPPERRDARGAPGARPAAPRACPASPAWTTARRRWSG